MAKEKRSKDERREWKSRPVRGNCLCWALRQWWRRSGYLVVRNADLAIPFLHFAWMPRHCKHIYHFRPDNEQVHLPWPYIRGFIKRHEDKTVNSTATGDIP